MLTALLVLAFTPGAQEAADSVQTATGYVFVDANKNGSRDPNERGLAGVRVSNGSDITRTDAKGQYRLPADDDTILFVIKPRGYRSPLSEDMLPRFY